MLPSQYSSLSVKKALKFCNHGYGIADFLRELIAYAQEHNINFMNLKQYYEKYKVIRI